MKGGSTKITNLIKTILAFTLLSAGRWPAQEWRPPERIYQQAREKLDAPQTKVERSTLDLYFIDVEGGAATLIVTPAGESMLIDAGWDGFDGRDANRIQQAMRQAGVTTIDHLVVTHYHRDHL
jgi:beta-lactamase superfamily II metal-dependent hydrolase